MKSPTHDRRAERTRDLLSNALGALMLERHYDQISVQDIVERAGVGRSTFYAHYPDKDALLAGQFERVLEGLAPDALTGADPAALRRLTAGLFRHVQQNQRLLAAFRLGAADLPFRNAQNVLTAAFETYLAALPAGPGARTAPPAGLMAAGLAGSLVSLLRWWLENNQPASPEEMSAAFQRLALAGAWAALDYHPQVSP